MSPTLALNYDVEYRELLAIKLALEECRHWFEGAEHPFTVWTDHKNVEYLQQSKRRNSRQGCWALFFTRLNLLLDITFCHSFCAQLGTSVSLQMEAIG